MTGRVPFRRLTGQIYWLEPVGFALHGYQKEVIDKYDSLPASESSADTGIEYCRVGEDDSDTEYRANGDCYGYLSVSVKCDQEDGFKPKPKAKPKAKSKK